MRARFCLFAVAASLPPLFPASADEIVPTTYPFLPELVVNEEPDVCGPFHAVVTGAFLGPEFEISIIGREWPEADARRVEFGMLDIPDEAERPYYAGGQVLGARIDPDHDGKEEILAHVSWNHSWRGNQNFLVLYPSIVEFKKARIAVQTAELHASDQSGADNILGEAADVKYAIGSGSVKKADAKDDYWDWTWVEPQAIQVNGRYFVLNEGEVYDDDISTSLWQIAASGKTELSCRVLLFTDDTGYSTGSLRAAIIGELEDVLRRISGDEPFLSGTLRAQTRSLGRGGRTASRIALRPWVMVSVDPYNDRTSVELALKSQSYNSLWDYRLYRRWKEIEPAALRFLTDYYETSFGLSRDDALNWAASSVDRLIRSFFTFPSGNPRRELTAEEIADWGRRQPLTLRRALLEGRSPGEIRTLLTAKNSCGPDAYPLNDSQCPSDPILVFALEHPTLITTLLANGIEPNMTNIFGKTPLMYAAHFNLPESARLLLEAGANINAQTIPAPNDGRHAITYAERTALMYALENAGAEMVALLLNAGADPNARDSGERDALDYLALNDSLTEKERAEIETMLHEAGYRAAAP